MQFSTTTQTFTLFAILKLSIFEEHRTYIFMLSALLSFAQVLYIQDQIDKITLRLHHQGDQYFSA